MIMEVHASGLCHADIDILFGRYGNSTFPLVPGYEFSGEIIAVGDKVSDIQLGDRVAIDPDFRCRQCRPCGDQSLAQR